MTKRRVLWVESLNFPYQVISAGAKLVSSASRTLVRGLGPRTSAKSRAEVSWPMRRRRRS